MSAHTVQYNNIRTQIDSLFTIICTNNSNIETLKKSLNGFDINFVSDFESYFADRIFISDPSDILIFYMKDLDIRLLSWIGEVKKMISKPVVVISDEHDMTLEVSVLRLGADDYWGSINSREIFRIRTERILQKFRTSSLYKQFNLRSEIHRNNSALKVDKRWHDFFTPYEFLALTTLLENQGEIITREEISLVVRGRASTHNDPSRDRSADNLLSRIRSKLKRLGVYKNDIKCFNGGGYAFIGDRDELVTALDALLAEGNIPNGTNDSSGH